MLWKTLIVTSGLFLLSLFVTNSALAGQWKAAFCNTTNTTTQATTEAPEGSLADNYFTKACLDRTGYPLSSYAAGVQQSGGVGDGKTRAQAWKTFTLSGDQFFGGWLESVSSPTVFIRPGGGTHACAWLYLINIFTGKTGLDVSCVTSSNRGSWFSGGNSSGGEGTYSLNIPTSVLSNRADGMLPSGVALGLRCQNSSNCASGSSDQMIYWKNLNISETETIPPSISASDSGQGTATSGTIACPVDGSSCGTAYLKVMSLDRGGGVGNLVPENSSDGSNWSNVKTETTTAGAIRNNPAPPLVYNTLCSASVLTTIASACGINFNPTVSLILNEANGFDMNGVNRLRFCAWDFKTSNTYFNIGAQGCSTVRTFRLDNTLPPAPTITEKPPAITADPDPEFSFTGEDGGSFQCHLDSGGEQPLWSACSSPKPYGPLADGDYTFYVRQLDQFGRAGPSSSWSFTVDTTPMTATWTQVPSSPSNANSFQYEIIFSENVSGIAAADFKNLGTATGCAYSTDTGSGVSAVITVIGCSEGTLTLTLKAESLQYPRGLGPDQEVVASEVVINRTPPASPTIISGPSGITGNTMPAWSWTGAETGGYFECQLDDSDWQVCISPEEYGPLLDGEHSFKVRQVDDAGNIGADASRTIQIDTLPPTATWTEYPNSPTSSSVLNYQLSFSNAVEGLDENDFLLSGTSSECSISLSASSGVTFDVYLSNCSEGDVVLSLLADSVIRTQTGIAGPASDVFAPVVEVDRSAPPAPTIISGPSGVTSNRSPEFIWTGGVDETFQCQLQGSGIEDWLDCTSPKNYNLLNNGSYTFLVRAIDAAGNISNPTGRSFTIQAAIPTASLKALSSSPTASKTLLFEVAWNQTVRNLVASAFRVQGTASGCQVYPASNSGQTIQVEVRDCSLGSVALELLANSAQGSSEPGPGSSVVSPAVRRACPNPSLQVKKATLKKMSVRIFADGCQVTTSVSYGKLKGVPLKVIPSQARVYNLKYGKKLYKKLKQQIRKKPRVKITALTIDKKQRVVKTRVRRG